MKQIYFIFLIISCSSQVIAQPLNDNPCGAINLTLNSSCNLVAGTNVNATNTANIPDPGCGSYNGQDVWFKTTVPANGCVIVSTTQNSMTDSGMAFYSAPTCAGPFTLIDCDDDSGLGAMAKLTGTALFPGTTLYIRVWDHAGGTGTFNICAQSSVSPCGGAINNDYCPYPATLTQGPGNFSATTDGTFSADKPGNLTANFCGTIENNSWYQFIATSTTHTFPIVSVTGCNDGRGIQAQVYRISKNTSGCCTGFTSVSNCYNPGNTSLGTVTATGLTIGMTYVLMIDGYAGDGCEFSIAGWLASGVLPIELSSFTVENTEFGNLLSWTTESEFHNDHFEIEYSRDAYSFETIGEVQGSGTTQNQQKYSFLHQGISAGTHYYQLVQIDDNGDRTVSKTIVIKSDEQDGLFKIYPNPTNNETTLTFQNGHQSNLTINMYDDRGLLAYNEQLTNLLVGKTYYTINTSTLRAGVYTLEININNSISRQRIIVIH